MSDIDAPDPYDHPIHDPHEHPHAYLTARWHGLRQAHHELAGALLFKAAPVLRRIFGAGAAHVLVTLGSGRCDSCGRMQFRRVETAAGETIATTATVASLGVDDRDLFDVALATLRLAVEHHRSANGHTAGRRSDRDLWSIRSDHPFEMYAVPPLTTVITLPPAVLRSGDALATRL